MKITWTFYMRGQGSVTLTVMYWRDLDSFPNHPGFLHVESNTAFVNWSVCRLFEKADLADRKYAYTKLVRLSDADLAKLKTGVCMVA